MRYLVLATDYDGTIASDGAVSEPTIDALEQLGRSGRRIVLVTGRQLEDLRQACSRMELFDCVVAENGAVLYVPRTREQILLTEPPVARFVAALEARGVMPLSVGQAIVATSDIHAQAVLETIQSLGLELQVIFNKHSLMVLPSGVNKASGLQAALDTLHISAHNTVGIGDAENDHAFLRLCECSVAVANALPAVMETADFVTQGACGAGAVELISQLLEDDLERWEPRLTRHDLLLGTEADGATVAVAPYNLDALIVGTSGSGKSTAATGLIEQLTERGYTYCVIDPEGDYQGLPGAVVVGSAQQPPDTEQLLRLLAEAAESVTVNLMGVRLTDRPAYFQELLPRLFELRSRVGRPHWLVIDEAHHLLPNHWQADAGMWPSRPGGLIMITVHPNLIAASTLSTINTLIVVGKQPGDALSEFAEITGHHIDSNQPEALQAGQALIWRRDTARPPFEVTLTQSQTDRKRHQRKYAEGELGTDRSFYFRGPSNRLNLRAQNLIVFVQIAEGIDDETWNYHLRRGDYSLWLEQSVKDEGIAAEVRRIEQTPGLSALESRAQVRTVLDQRYTLPA